MLNSTSDRVCFTSASILTGLTYHFQELGICRSLEESLVEKVEQKVGNNKVYFKQDVWQMFSSDLERALILLDLARVTRQELEESPQGRRLLALESQFVRMHGLRT